MTTQAILAVAGGAAGTLGSIITAFSVNRILAELKFAYQTLSVTVEGLATNQTKIPVFTGLEKRFERAEFFGSVIVWGGVGLLAVGFVLQLISSLL